MRYTDIDYRDKDWSALVSKLRIRIQKLEQIIAIMTPHTNFTTGLWDELNVVGLYPGLEEKDK